VSAASVSLGILRIESRQGEERLGGKSLKREKKKKKTEEEENKVRLPAITLQSGHEKRAENRQQEPQHFNGKLQCVGKVYQVWRKVL